MLVKSINPAVSSVKVASPTNTSTAKLEATRAAFMAELNQFTQNATHEPGDSGVDRMHAANCLLATLSKEPISSEDGSLVSTQLVFGIHATSAARIPESLAQAMVNLATALGQKITSVVLPENQTASFKWLACMEQVEITSSATGISEMPVSDSAHKLKMNAIAQQSGGLLEDARANFMAEVALFRKGATGAPGDFSVHREHVLKHLLAAVRDDEPDPEVLNFVSSAQIPKSLKQATVDLAAALGREIKLQ